MHNRIKEIRKYFKLSQTDFGNRIGTTRDTIANIEANRIEIKEIYTKAICKEFEINYLWLTKGLYTMFSREIHNNNNPLLIDKNMKEDFIKNLSLFLKEAHEILDDSIMGDLSEENTKKLDALIKKNEDYLKNFNDKIKNKEEFYE